MANSITRRAFVQTGVLGLAVGSAQAAATQSGDAHPVPRGQPTRFQVACMTLPYSAFPLERALRGIRDAGYRHVAWGTTHREAGGKPVPVLAADAPVDRARDLATRCRDLGLEPVMMFSGIYPEAKNGLEVLRRRLLQAGAAKVPQVLTFGHTRGGNHALWVQRFKELAPIAQDQGVLLVVKQHGGETGTGDACARITATPSRDNRSAPPSTRPKIPTRPKTNGRASFA